MEIAGTAVRVEHRFAFTKEYCREYLSARIPEFSVSVSKEDLEAEQVRLAREAVEQGLKTRNFGDPFLERSVIQHRIADYLVNKDTVMLHGSTVAVDGRAYLFTAPCGTGKSTHTGLWRELLGRRAVMVNDDMPFLQVTPAGVLAYGSPWSGKHGLANNVCMPLQGICLLHRGTVNSIVRSGAEDLTHVLREQVHVPEDKVLAQKTFSLLDAVTEQVPLWQMHCTRDLEAAQVAYAAMCGEGGA
jgi:hypothetical protein